MKKLLLFTAASMFSLAVIAQDAKENPAADHPSGHSCYMLKDNALIHCMGTSAIPQETDVELENGMMISRAGKVVMADGKSVEMKNGQCIDMQGMIGDCVEMHKDMMKGSDADKPEKM